MTDLIGKQFKYNKYGPSIWTDTITKITYKLNFCRVGGAKVEVYVIGTSKHWYELENVIVLYEARPAHILQRLSHEKTYSKR